MTHKDFEAVTRSTHKMLWSFAVWYAFILLLVLLACGVAKGTPPATAVAVSWAWETERAKTPTLPPKKEVPGVISNAPFHWPHHSCPSCHYQSPAGQGTWIIRGYNRDGSHLHSCPRCGTTWSH